MKLFYEAPPVPGQKEAHEEMMRACRAAAAVYPAMRRASEKALAELVKRERAK